MTAFMSDKEPSSQPPELPKLPDRPEFQHKLAAKKTHLASHLFVFVLLGLIILVGLVAYYNYHYVEKYKSVANNPSVQHVDWKSYTSSAEKATFRYPGNWTITKPFMVSNDVNNTDQVGISSPSGAIKISWVTDLVGFGGEHGTNYPYNSIINKTAIAKAPGLYVVSGITTLDGTSYNPWVAVEDANGIISNGVQGNVVTFTSHRAINPTTDDFTGILFSTSGARTNQNTPAFTKAQATAWFSSTEAQEARIIMLSLQDAANLVANWYLYNSPGNHYAMRIPDGWNLVQNCSGPYAQVLLYPDSGNTLAINQGAKGTVANECFGRDATPTLSIQWYDFANPNDDAQKLLDSFSATSSNFQKETSLQTDTGLTIDKYYEQVTQPPQNIMQPQQGIFYDYVIKNSTGYVLVFSHFSPIETDYHTNIEEALKTLILNN